jgi:AcrR family transcriptional regulator
MERRAIFSAALRLINEGKFHAATLPEIALYANISASTLPYFFATRQILLSELTAEVLASLHGVAEEIQNESLSFQNRFFRLGTALFRHYVDNPQVIALIEQFHRNSSNEVNAGSFQKFHNRLAEFFGDGIAGNYISDYNPETMAVIFHDHVIAAAKTYNGSDNEDLGVRLKILWEGISIK